MEEAASRGTKLSQLRTYEYYSSSNQYVIRMWEGCCSSMLTYKAIKCTICVCTSFFFLKIKF